MSDGTIDITNVVQQMKEVWVRATTEAIIKAVAAIPALSWLALPVISPIFEIIVHKILTIAADTTYMLAFFTNTAIRKGAQAVDFIAAVDFKNALPTTATDEEYENAERAEIVAFANFVRVTN